MSHEHTTSPGPNNEPTPQSFLYVRPLDHDPNPSAPMYEAEIADLETIPTLDQSQIDAMLDNPWASSEELAQLGLPVGDGVAAFRVGDEVKYFNINPSEDYGTLIRPDNIRLLAPEKSEIVDDGMEQESSPTQAEKVGEGVLDVVGIEDPKVTQELPTFEAAKERVAAIAAPGAMSMLAKELMTLGSTPEAIVRELHDNSEAQDDVRSVLTVRLHMLLDEMPDQIKDGREKNVADPKLYGGKLKMPSRDYTVEIALAYLDGSFKADTQERGGHGKDGIGEHRTAAQKILESFAKEAPQTKPEEKELFTDDRLQVMALELRGETEVVSGELGRLLSPDGLIAALRNDLQQSFVDTDVLAQYAVNLRVTMERSMDTLLREVYTINKLMGAASFHDNPQDVAKAESLRGSLQLAANVLDGARNSWSTAHVFALVQNADQQLVLQLKAANTNGMLEEQLVNEIEKTRRIIDELIQTL